LTTTQVKYNKAWDIWEAHCCGRISYTNSEYRAKLVLEEMKKVYKYDAKTNADK
jgi:hypothetical protein